MGVYSAARKDVQGHRGRYLPLDTRHLLREPRTRPVSVCFVAPNLGPILRDDSKAHLAGGAELRQQILARAFARRGLDVSLVTLDRGDGTTITPEGIRIFVSHRQHTGLPLIRFIHPRLTSWWRGLRQANADIYIQSAAGFLTLVVACFCRLYGRRFVYSAAHDLDLQPKQLFRLFQRRAGWRDRHMFRAGIQMADAIVVQHSRQAVSCLASYKREPTVIPNCYDPPLVKNISDAGVVLWVATIRAWKRPELFLQLARMLPTIRFRMIGGPSHGPDADLFCQIRSEAKQIPNLEFLGFVPMNEVEGHFDAARVFVNTSDFEGFPNTFLQSWSRGIPTVSFVECGSTFEGKNIGVTCRNIDDMSREVFRLVEDSRLWTSESTRCRRYALNHHSVEGAVTAYCELFARLLSPQVL